MEYLRLILSAFKKRVASIESVDLFEFTFGHFIFQGMLKREGNEIFLKTGRKEMIKTVCQFSIFRVFSDLISFVNFSSIARNL